MIWRDEYAVGVPEIDEQHRKLIDMISGFYGAIGSGEQARAALGQLLGSLLDYTRYHFSTEERLMTASYPAARSHQEEHDGFVAKVNDMSERFHGGRLVLSIEATSFIRDWLIDHIMKADKELAAHLTRRA